MAMALLKSVDNVPGINFYEYRDREFYNKYDYRMRVKIPCVRYTWFCKNPEDLDTKIKGKFKGYGNIKKEDLPAVTDNIEALKAIIIIQSTRKKHKDLGVRIEGATVAIFSNDLSVLQALEPIIGTRYSYDYTQVQTSEYAGVKLFVNDPPNKYRVYLKSRRVSDTFVDELKELLQRTPTLHPSTALKAWLTGTNRFSWRYKFSSASHFIDYNDESTLSYLALIHGEMLGKKYKLEKRPEV
jgi:hypothetical protein